MSHVYSPETLALLAAIEAGECCEVCGAANYDRHFDECPMNPDNDGAIRCVTCDHPRVDHYQDGPCGHRIRPTMQPCTCTKYEGEA